MQQSLTTDACTALLAALHALDSAQKLSVMHRFDMALNIGRLRNIELAAQRVREGLICKYSDPNPKPGSGGNPTQVAPDKAEAFVKEVQALGEKSVTVDLEMLPQAAVIEADVSIAVLAGLMPILVDDEGAKAAGASKANGHAEPASAAAHAAST